MYEMQRIIKDDVIEKIEGFILSHLRIFIDLSNIM